MRTGYADEELRLVLGRSKNLSFEEFVGFLERVALIHNDIHHRRQSKPIERRMPEFFDSIVKLESFAEDVAELNTLSGADLNVDGLSSSHHAEKINTDVSGAEKLRWNDIKDHIPEYHNFYSAPIRKRVEKVYREDIDRYQYSFPF